MSNILEQANKIINERSEEKERQYGPMGKGFERAAMIASGMSGKEWSAHDMFIAMVSLKFSRQSYNFKEDNLLDACAYIGAWQNYIDDNEQDHTSPVTGVTNEKDDNKTLLTEENEITKEFYPEEDTQEFFGQETSAIAQSPYSVDSNDPRALLEAMIKIGEMK
jgi:hypothetical protein